jgi:hypothetical protein
MWKLAFWLAISSLLLGVVGSNLAWLTPTQVNATGLVALAAIFAGSLMLFSRQ